MRIGDGYQGQEPTSTTGWVAAAVVLAVGLALTAAAVVWQQQRTRNEAQALQDRQVERLRGDLHNRLAMPVYGLKGAQSLLATRGGQFDRATFRTYVLSRDLAAEFPGVHGFGFIQRVEHADVDAYVAAQRRAGATGFALRQPGPASPHYIVAQTEPAETNAAAWGLDSGADAERRRAIEHAVDSGEATLSGPIPLVQDPQKGLGFLLYMPVYEGGHDPGTPAARRAALHGLFYAPLVVREVLKGVMEPASALLDLKLSARAVDGRLVPLLALHDGASLSPGEAADFDLDAAPLAGAASFTIRGREFVMQAAPTHGTALSLFAWSGVGLQVGGALLSLLLAVTVYLLAAGRARAEQLARGMTAELGRLAMVASHTTNAVAITDRDGRISWVNDGFTRMSGFSSDEALGQRPGTLLHSDEADPAALRTLAEAVGAGRGCQLELVNRSKAGRSYWVDLEVQPLRDEGGALTGFVIIENDITARKALQAQADEARESLQDLYDNAPCAYYALDAEGRFLQINALGLKWLGCEAGQLIGRASPADFFDDAGRALFREAFPRFKREGRISGLEFDLTGRHGQTRRVSLSATAIYGADGGFLRSRSVMFDISETHRIRQQLHQLTLDQEAMLQSDLVGIAKLRDRRVAWRNPALERMFGYGEGELLDTPARQLYADDTAYETLGALAYPQLRAGGRFRTQLQMRRKDGALIWVDLSGVQLPGSGGESLWMMVDITQSKAHEARMERAALHDPLTGLPNRLLLADRLRQAIRSAERGQQEFVLAYLDLNGFKEVNDNHGHNAGDEVLKIVGARLQAGLRAGDTVARLGGDEFVVLLTPREPPAEAEPALRRLTDELNRPITLTSGAQVSVGGSLGLARYPADGSTPEALMHLSLIHI